MRICVYGAGATGGHVAAKLAEAGHAVSVVVRGSHLEAIRAKGLTLFTGERRIRAEIAASDDPEDLGVQDAVFVCVKATGLAAVAAGLGPLVTEHTLVAFPQNGMSWWYPLGLDVQLPKPPKLAVFALAEAFLDTLSLRQILGASILSANEVIEPGVVLNNSPTRNVLTFGSLVAGREAEIAALRATIEASGMSAPAVDDIRKTVWSKLLINMSASTIALATGAQSSLCRTDPALGEIFRRIVREGQATAGAHGYDLSAIDPERLIANLPDHKPSLLQDYERRRPMEVAEIIEAPLAFARAAGIATPTFDALGAVAIHLARVRGLTTPHPN